MTINIFVLKGDLNGKIVVVRFFFCRVYFVSALTIFIWLFSLHGIPNSVLKGIIYPMPVLIRGPFSYLKAANLTSV